MVTFDHYAETNEESLVAWPNFGLEFLVGHDKSTHQQARSPAHFVKLRKLSWNLGTSENGSEEIKQLSSQGKKLPCRI